jgi:hypothetical protein
MGTTKRNRDFKLNIFYFGNYAYVTNATVFCYFILWIWLHSTDPREIITSWRMFLIQKNLDTSKTNIVSYTLYSDNIFLPNSAICRP